MLLLNIPFIIFVFFYSTANLVVVGNLANGPWQYNVTVQVSDQFGNVYMQTVEITVIPPVPTTVMSTNVIPTTMGLFLSSD